MAPGTSLPLLKDDRLVEAGGPEELSGPPGATGGGRARWRASLRRELERLLNTRLTPGRALAPEEDATVTGYGIPDWTAVNPASKPELAGLAAAIAAQVEKFEPRLGAVRVRLEADGRRRDRAHGTLEGVARGGAGEAVRFALELDALGAAVLETGDAEA